MKVKKPIGIGLLAGLLALAFAALPALASAAPTFTPSSGVFPVAFTGTSGTSTLLAGGIEVVCEDDTASGAITSPSESEVTVTFTGCNALEVIPCASEGEPEGTIMTGLLSGKLVYLDEAPHSLSSRFGLELKPAGGGALATFSCGGIPVEVTGSVLGQITEPGLKQESGGFKLNLADDGEGGQEFTQIEETGPVHQLEAAIGIEPPVPAVEITEEVVTYTGQKGEFLP